MKKMKLTYYLSETVTNKVTVDVGMSDEAWEKMEGIDGAYYLIDGLSIEDIEERVNNPASVFTGVDYCLVDVDREVYEFQAQEEGGNE